MGAPRLGQTPWQTVGPFFHYALPHPGGGDLVGGAGAAPGAGARPDLTAPGHFALRPLTRDGGVAGEVIEIEGRVTDGAGEPLPDALIEIWQADAEGGYAGPFPRFGRTATADDGGFRFRTVRPGRVAGPGNSLQAAHIAVGVMGRGLLRRLVTRIYFEEDSGLDEDPILALTPPDRRKTLMARAIGPSRYRFDIVLQGEGETVFFDV
jgi:protocatechuate 3,4-dioxygenase alpha subunit